VANDEAKFVTRAAWGARAPESTTRLSNISHVVFHYTAANADEQADHRNCASRVRGVQRYHMDHNGWNDIAYNFVVCKHGYIFEGRGFWNRSAATGHANGYTVAVCFLGDDSVGHDDVTSLGRDALVSITKSIQSRWRKELGYKGHRDYMSTTCPGNEIIGFIRSPTFDRRVNGEPSYLPGPVPKPPWFFPWLEWKLGRRPNRPADAPRFIPLWAWRARREWIRRHP
jgi:hypothetical protein